MKVTFFSSQPYEIPFFQQANHQQHLLLFLSHTLNQHTCQSAENSGAICVFVNDILDAPVLDALKQQGVKLIALRCAGYNQLDLTHANTLGLTVVRVPAYSPHAVAEHAVGLILMLNRHLHRAYHRVRELDFSLHGLIGFDLYKKTVGVIGTGKIGEVFAQIMLGFGCQVIAYDPHVNPTLTQLGITYAPLKKLAASSDIISLHCPLTTDTHHIINADTLQKMKKGVMLINTGRGSLIDTQAVINALKSGQVGALGLDVYEEEGGLFFVDQSDQIVQDDTLARLLTFPNVVITGHQAYLTREALQKIAETTLDNITAFETGKGTLHRVT